MDTLDIFIFLDARGRVNLAALELQLVAAGGSDHCGFMFGSRYVMLNQIAQSCRAKTANYTHGLYMEMGGVIERSPHWWVNFPVPILSFQFVLNAPCSTHLHQQSETELQGLVGH